MLWDQHNHVLKPTCRININNLTFSRCEKITNNIFSAIKSLSKSYDFCILFMIFSLSWTRIQVLTQKHSLHKEIQILRFIQFGNRTVNIIILICFNQNTLLKCINCCCFYLETSQQLERNLVQTSMHPTMTLNQLWAIMNRY